jgi:hypothetical protein
MFSIRQKREIADAIHKILRATDHPELPPHPTEIRFELKVWGVEVWSWAVIKNNGAVLEPEANPFNEAQDPRSPL